MKINTKPFVELINNYCQYDTEASIRGREAWTEIIKLAEAVNSMLPEVEENLKECPFCLFEPHLTNDDNWIYVRCETDGCYMRGFTSKHLSKTEAIKKWNARNQELKCSK